MVIHVQCLVSVYLSLVKIKYSVCVWKKKNGPHQKKSLKKKKTGISVMSLPAAAFLSSTEALDGWTQPWAVLELGVTPRDGLRGLSAVPTLCLQGQGALVPTEFSAPSSLFPSLMSCLHDWSSALVSLLWTEAGWSWPWNPALTPFYSQRQHGKAKGTGLCPSIFKSLFPWENK